jgi:hypothetical protein
MDCLAYPRCPRWVYDDGTVTIYHGDATWTIWIWLPTLDDPWTWSSRARPTTWGSSPVATGAACTDRARTNKAGRFRDGYGVHDDALPQDEYDAWQRRCSAECWDA